MLQRLVPLVAVLLALLALPTPAPAATTTTTQVPVCKRAPHGRVGCFAIRVDRYAAGRIRHSTAPIGYTPQDLRDAYSLPASPAGSGMTVAVVDAYDDPQAEHDLATYRSQFGTPPFSSRNGCFRKVGQSGGRTYPAPDPGWAQEISLDLDMVAAGGPACPTRR